MPYILQTGDHFGACLEYSPKRPGIGDPFELIYRVYLPGGTTNSTTLPPIGETPSCEESRMIILDIMNSYTHFCEDSSFIITTRTRSRLFITRNAVLKGFV